mmetsp:Transcript_117/g.320  ORF Transcript_117/g.320 Transcript_117/m.320 type:complete len:201 (-) Transcript_117:581-1183(-)
MEWIAMVQEQVGQAQPLVTSGFAEEGQRRARHYLGQALVRLAPQVAHRSLDVAGALAQQRDGILMVSASQCDAESVVPGLVPSLQRRPTLREVKRRDRGAAPCRTQEGRGPELVCHVDPHSLHSAKACHRFDRVCGRGIELHLLLHESVVQGHPAMNVHGVHVCLCIQEQALGVKRRLAGSRRVDGDVQRRACIWVQDQG